MLQLLPEYQVILGKRILNFSVYKEINGVGNRDSTPDCSYLER